MQRVETYYGLDTRLKLDRDSVVTRQTLRVAEWHLYGSSRLGIHKTQDTLRTVDLSLVYKLSDVNIAPTQTLSKKEFYSFDSTYTHKRGDKLYEGSNHLGNVLVTFSDKRLAECLEGSVHYQADVRSAADYAAFHSQLDDRQWYSSTDSAFYRYGGSNGQEKDDEIYGTGNSYSAEFWQYDPRLARRWNVDPVVKVFESPYASFGNNPILLVDRNGADTSSSTSEASKFIQQAISPTKEVKRNWLGRMLTGEKMKTVENDKDKYQPKIAEIVNRAANDPNVRLTFTTEAIGLNVEGAAGAMIKTGEKSYTVYFDPNADIRSIGTYPAYEEIFHFDNAYSGIAKYTLKDGQWGIWNNGELLDEEARAKHQVITNIREINVTFRYNMENIHGYSELHSDFGYMIYMSMTESQIRTFISTGRGTEHKYDVWGFGYSGKQIIGEVPVTIPSQGAYDYLVE